MTPSVVLFDADGVLQQPRGTWRDDLVGLIDSTDPATQDRFLDDISVAEVPTLTGEVDFAEALAAVLAAWGVTRPVAEVLALWDDIDVDPEMIAGVRRLNERGLRCVLTTNQHAQRAAAMQRTLRYDEVFERSFYSCEIGLAKPDPAYFELRDHPARRVRRGRPCLWTTNPATWLVHGPPGCGLSCSSGTPVRPSSRGS